MASGVSSLAAPTETTESPVNFVADELVHDDLKQEVVATGHVQFTQTGRILRAEKVRYDLRADRVFAIGNVVLVEANGDTYYADELELTDQLREGFVSHLRGVLADGSRLWADTGTRTGGNDTLMRHVVYTPCEPCKLDPTRPPLWQLRARSAKHDQAAQEMSYKDVTFEVLGTPVLYTPIFSHVDGTVKQKSGFLTPTLRFDSQNGTSVGTHYYWGIAPDRDATFGVEMYTNQAPRALAEYRQRFADKSVELRGSTTYSKRRVKVGDSVTMREEDARGHLESQMRWDMNEKWRSGLDVKLASDDQYFKQYKVTSEDVVENQIYAERFDGRDYAAVRALAFQDLRTSNRASDQPNIFPEGEARFLTQPNQIAGGRGQVQLAALGLQRSGSGADMTRFNVTGDWQRRDILAGGVVNTLNASLRGDAYYLLDRNDGGAGVGGVAEQSLFRAVPIVHNETSYPLVKSLDAAELFVEPVAALTLVPDLKQGAIPNEDSQDVQIDTASLFASNRFPGFDRVEDMSRVTYGARTGITTHAGETGEIFMGQSYRLDNRDNPFPKNSGLADQQSDYVGRMKINLPETWQLDYAWQLARDDLSSVRHEVDSQLDLDPVTLGMRYLYARSIEGVGVAEAREQAHLYGSYRVASDMRVNSGMQYDLSAVDSGLRNAFVGFDYLGQCATLSGTLTRNLTNSTSGTSATELWLRVGFKNLGEFQTSGISLRPAKSE